MEVPYSKGDLQLEQEVSDVEFVPEELAFLNQSNDRDLSVQHDDVDLDKEDIYIPDDADDASLLNVLNDSDNWREKLSQSRRALDQMKNGKDELSKYKRKIWRMKQKIIGLESEIAVQKSQVELTTQQMDELKEEKEKCIAEREASEKATLQLEDTIVSLKSIISTKNRDIASLERRLAEANRHLTLTTSEIHVLHEPMQEERDEQEEEGSQEAQEGQSREPSESTLEELTTLRNRVAELEEKLAQHESSVEQDEESRLESLESFVGLVRTIAYVKSKEEGKQILRMNGGKCFHCGRDLSECLDSEGDSGCNYCSILNNLIKEEAPIAVNSKPDPFAFVLFFFISVTILLAIFVYNWRDEALIVLQSLKDKITSSH